RRRFKGAFRDEPREAHIHSLNGMARSLGVRPLYDDAEKSALQKLASGGPPSDADRRRRLGDYCLSDTLATQTCLPKLVRRPEDWGRAIVRADFAALVAARRSVGIPVRPSLARLLELREPLRDRAIRDWDWYGLYRGGSFSNRAFAELLAAMN